MGTDRYGEKNGSYLQPSVQIRTNPYKSVQIRTNPYRKSLHTNSLRGQVGQVGLVGLVRQRSPRFPGFSASHSLA